MRRVLQALLVAHLAIPPGAGPQAKALHTTPARIVLTGPNARTARDGGLEDRT
jgi:hypothetical protein